MRWTAIGMWGALAVALSGPGALAGCSSGDGGNNSSEASAGIGAQQEQTPSNLTDDPQNGMVPVTLPSPRPIASIPAAFHGRWGMVVNDCVAGGTGKGLMVVGGSSLSLGGSRATIGSLAAIDSGTLTAQLGNTGGKAGPRANRLTLLDDGNTLTRQEQDPAGSFRYSRCPA